MKLEIKKNLRKGVKFYEIKEKTVEFTNNYWLYHFMNFSEKI